MLIWEDIVQAELGKLHILKEKINKTIIIIIIIILYENKYICFNKFVTKRSLGHFILVGILHLKNILYELPQLKIYWIISVLHVAKYTSYHFYRFFIQTYHLFYFPALLRSGHKFSLPIVLPQISGRKRIIWTIVLLFKIVLVFIVRIIVY